MLDTIYKSLVIHEKADKILTYEIYKMKDLLVLNRNKEEKRLITELHQNLRELYDFLEIQEQEKGEN